MLTAVAERRGASLALVKSLIRLVCFALCMAVLLLALSGVASAATPEPSIVGVGDPRSEGEGPGLVGSPIVIALGVIRHREVKRSHGRRL